MDSREDARARRALVTGASGFIGRHLARRLLLDGWEVAVTRRSSSRLPEDLTGACELIDVETTFEEFSWRIQQFAPQACFHLATHFSNTSGGMDIDLMVDANISFGARLLESLDRVGGVRLVNAGSRMQHFSGESYRPVSFYAATKQAYMDVMKYYADVRGLPSVTVEFPDTYGPDDPRPKLLPLLRRAAVSGGPLDMSAGDQLIEIVHVSDAVAALLGALRMSSAQSPTFTVTGESLPLRSFVALVSEVWDMHIPVHWGVRPYREREMMTAWNYWPQLPGWSAEVQLREGLVTAIPVLERLS